MTEARSEDRTLKFIVCFDTQETTVHDHLDSEKPLRKSSLWSDPHAHKSQSNYFVRVPPDLREIFFRGFDPHR
jgi:hypothetical protein